MRMLEEILSDAVPHRLEDHKAWFKQGEVFLIDNVAEYLYAQTNQERWVIQEDFPCLAPPFQRFWMEFSRPSKILCSNEVLSSAGLPYRVGLWFDFTPEFHLKFNQIFEAERIGFDPDNASNLRNMASQAWQGSCCCFTQAFRHGPIDGPLTHHLLGITATGAIEEELTFVNTVRMQQSFGADWEAAANTATTFWWSGLLAISFCHCKNVTVQREEIPARLAKRRTERSDVSLSYKILEITPMKKVLEKAGAQAQTGLKKALHICRGHFAEYRDHGLFGKYKGRFWIPQHIRGVIEAGVALKSYDVRPPK